MSASDKKTALKKPGMAGIEHPELKIAANTPQSMELALAVGGKKVVVVGGTNGLGRAIATLCHTLGAKVTVAGRTFQDEGSGITFVKTDLESMKAAVELGKQLPADIDVLILTAGIMAASTRQVTAEGLERDMAVSFLSRLALLRELAPRMGEAAAKAAKGATGQAAPARPRVFVMAFPGAGQEGDLEDLMGEKKYSAWGVHMNTVACNEALVLQSAEKYPQLAFFGVNPGMVRTGIRSNLLGSGFLSWIAESIVGALYPTADQFAAKMLPALFSPQLESFSGRAHINPKPAAILPSAVLTPERVKAIMDKSDEFIAKALKS